MSDQKSEYVEDTFQKKAIESNEIVLLRGRKNDVFVGKDLKLKINSSVGASDIKDYENEVEKIKQIALFDVLPDIMMDLSIVSHKVPLYEIIQKEIGCPIGVVPVYTCFDEEKGISKNKLLETIEQMAENGVAFMTMHFTGTQELYKRTKVRNIPVISRGGSLVLRDLHINNRKENVLMDSIDDICKIIKKHSVVVSVGTTYRPSSLYDALDDVHLKEIKLQKDIIKFFMRNQVKVIMEGVGHISLKDLTKYVDNIRSDFYVPFMPLGPIPTDRAVGWDHVSSAIGISHMAMMNGVDIANAVTREEHTGGIPTIDSIYEAIRTTNVVVETVEDVRRFSEYNKKQLRKRKNCLQYSDEWGCERCKNECPFILEKIRK